MASEPISKCNNEDMALLGLYDALDRNDDSAAFGYAYYLVDPFVDREETSFLEWLTEERSKKILDMIERSERGKEDLASPTVWKFIKQVKEIRAGKA